MPSGRTRDLGRGWCAAVVVAAFRSSGLTHRLQAARGFFPVGGGGCDLIDDTAEFAIQLLGATGSGVGFGRFQRGGEVGLFGLELSDEFFELADLLATFANFVGGGFGCGGRGLLGNCGGLWLSRLFRPGVAEAGGEGSAGVAGVGFFQKIIVVAGIRCEAAGMDVEHGFRQRTDEVDVVADEDQRAFVVFERTDEGVDGLNIKVSRRLVHQEEVGRFHEDAGEGKAGFFTAGEDADGFVHVVFAEEESAEDGAGLLLGEQILIGAQRHHVLEHGCVGIEVIETVLGEVTGNDVAAEFAQTALDRDDVGENFEEGGFAGAVGADEDDALTSLSGEVEVFVDDVVAVGLLHMLKFDDFQPGTRGLRELEVHFPQFFGRFVNGDFFKAFDLFLFGFGA